MPAKVKVRILSARDLPVMDRASDLTDAFVEVRLGRFIHRTDVCRKSLNPQWNSEWFRFEVDDEDLQDEVVQIKVFDHDTYSAHDAIGKVYINLNPLLCREGPANLSGWFPIFDTMHGVRGEINVIVKLELFSDVNRYKQSSCGLQFFHSPVVPSGYKLQAVYGFVEELVVNDDPEHQWIDKIRTSRTSNEARQRLFSKLSGELIRKIGIKVLDMGGNSVVGYSQCFDLEGESGIVVRGIGTAVALVRHDHTSPHSSSPFKDHCHPAAAQSDEPSSPTTAPVRTASTVRAIPAINRRNSDSELSTTPKGSSLAGSSGSGSGSASRPVSYMRIVAPPPHIETMDFPFFTLRSFPRQMLLHLGGVVSARSVKLLSRIHNPEEPETRDAWWTELRTEIRSHARAMGCHAVIGYEEQTSICDEVIILSAHGTAATLNLTVDPSLDHLAMTQHAPLPAAPLPLTMSMDRSNFEKEKHKLYVDVNLANQSVADSHLYSLNCAEPHIQHGCEPCHIPYSDKSTPFPVNLSKCLVCRKHKVPDVLFTTVNIPEGLLTVGTGCLVQARICRPKRDMKNDEANAKEISDSLPFMEYELHQQLLNRLKVKAMNALFGLEIQMVVGETMLVAVATGTGVYLPAMAVPEAPKISGKANATNNQRVQALQKQVSDLMLQNKITHELNWDRAYEDSPQSMSEDSEDDERLDLDLSADNKDAFVLEIDDSEDEAGVTVLLEDGAPPGFYACTTDDMPGVPNLVIDFQMLTSVWQGEINLKTSQEVSTIFNNIFKGLFFHARSLVPCCLCKMSYKVDLLEKERLRISTCAMVAGLGEPARLLQRYQGGDQPSEELLFHMEDESEPALQEVSKSQKLKKKFPKYHTPPLVRHGINLTPLSSIPGARVDEYLGNLNFFYIRETTSLRENGGLSGFVQNFIAEVQAIVRSHVAALGGNAMVSYRMTECVLIDNIYKNQGQCLINVCGDATQVTYNLPQNMTPPVGTASKRWSGSPQQRADTVKTELFPGKKMQTEV